MNNTDGKRELGRAEIAPAEDVVAGRMGTWRVTHTAGPNGIAVGGGIRVGTDSDTDWGLPQFTDPAVAEYMTAEAPEGVDVGLRTRSVKSVEAIVGGRSLQEGETLTIVYGDRRGGGPGSRAQTFAEERRFFQVSVDVTGNGEWTPLEDSPCATVVGDAAVALVVTPPSMIEAGEEFRLIVKAEDRWGNPSASFRATVQLRGEGLAGGEVSIAFGENDNGVRHVDGLRFGEEGVRTIVCEAADAGLKGESNPIVVGQRVSGDLGKSPETGAADSGPAKSAHRLYWADPHGGQVVLNSKFGDFFRYARDVSGIQFVGFQRNADVISKEDWVVQQREERAFHEPGRFVPIPGYEWSGKSWHGGHHNVYFRRHGQPVRRNRPIERPDSVERETELHHIEDVYAAYRQADVIITAHVGGEHSNLDFHEPELEPGVEITSTHGTFEWMLRDALERGYKFGFLGGSDCYTGRPGDDRPGFQLRRYARAGLTGIFADGVTLPAFFEAMRARRTFATTGVRMVLRVEADGHLLGAEYATAELPTIDVSVIGAGPLESVELFRGLEKIHVWQPETEAAPNRVRILCSGSSRMTSYSGVVWDGVLRVRDGAITKAETVRFDSPRSHVVEQSAEMVRWHAWGCGYPMGLVVDLDGDERTRLEVSVGTQTITGPAFGRHGSQAPRRISFAPAEGGTLTVGLGELDLAGRELDLGVLERTLAVSAVRQPGPRAVEFRHVDRSPRPGVNPYWARVVQSDMNMGWSSPVYCDFVEPEE